MQSYHILIKFTKNFIEKDDKRLFSFKGIFEKFSITNSQLIG